MGKKKKTEQPPQPPETTPGLSGDTGLTETLKYLEGEMPEKGKKRGSYKQKECPYCHSMVGNLGNHVKLKHPAESPAPPELTKEDLLGVPTKEPKPATELKPPTYYCTDCKAELRKGENPCWNCGAVLNWEGLSD